MKKITALATIVACFALPNAKAQNVNGVRLSDIRVDYLELSQDRQIFSRKVHVILEYGQKASKESEAYVKDDDGRDMDFNSVLELVNKMKGYGYELFQAYTERDGKDSSKTKYILKRK